MRPLDQPHPDQRDDGACAKYRDDNDESSHWLDRLK
jgi:hypothetical protein